MRSARGENCNFFMDKIRKGAKPADLPVEQPTIFDFAINRAAAKTPAFADLYPIKVFILVAKMPSSSDGGRTYVASEALVDTRQLDINERALGARLPTIWGVGGGVQTGGLMSYGPSFPALFRRAAEYVDQILRGAKPTDLPVEQPTKFELVINLRTAKALGLDLAASLLARADEVIE